MFNKRTQILLLQSCSPQATTDIAVKDAEGGPGLAFIAYTTAVAEMPLPQLWAAAFFFMMVTLALNSEFGTVEACVTPLRDFKMFAKMPREVYKCTVK